MEASGIRVGRMEDGLGRDAVMRRWEEEREGGAMADCLLCLLELRAWGRKEIYF